MQQQIELNLSISVFFNPQQLRKPVVDYFLIFAFTSKAEKALVLRAISWVFIHLLISMEFLILSWFGGFIAVPSKY